MTEYKVFLSKDAELEINEITIWYEMKSESLGLRFFDCFDNYISQIIQNPFIYAIAFDNFRKVFMISFPYLIIYAVDIDKREVEVLGVYHTSRNPKTIKKKLRKI